MWKKNYIYFVICNGSMQYILWLPSSLQCKKMGENWKKLPFQMCLLLLALFLFFHDFLHILPFFRNSVYTAGWSMISSLINHKFFTQTKTFIILFICFRFPSTTPNFIQWAYSPWDRISPDWTCHRKFHFWSFHDSRSKRHLYHDIS